MRLYSTDLSQIDHPMRGPTPAPVWETGWTSEPDNAQVQGATPCIWLRHYFDNQVNASYGQESHAGDPKPPAASRA